jgi:hypothetical protein
MTKHTLNQLALTVGPAKDGRKLAVITSGGHPQLPGNELCTVCEIKVVDGWSKRKIAAWFERMKAERPWETRQ